MKKSTGVVFLLAAALAAFVYFYDMRHNPSSKPAVDTTHPTFSVAADDIRGITIQAGGATIALERKTHGWHLTQPLDTRADQNKVLDITTQLSLLRTERTLPAAPQGLASYGLDHPAETLAFTTKNNGSHQIQIGAKDFSGSYVYARVDGANGVLLLPAAFSAVSDKSASDLRDHAVLDVAVPNAASFELANGSGEISASKKDSDWTIEKPHASAADADAISSLLQAVGSAQITDFLDQAAPSDLAKYGLAKPAIDFRVSVPGVPAGAPGTQQAELQIGAKVGNDYYARDPSRPMIFRVNDALHKALSDTFGDLRDKLLVHFTESDIIRAEVQNQNGATNCVADASGELVIEQPASQKNPAPPCPDFLETLENARAQQIFDTPPANIAAKLVKPAVQATLTEASGKKTEVSVSAVSDNAVYARTSAGPQIYKLDKQVLEDLNAKEPVASSAVPAPSPQ